MGRRQSSCNSNTQTIVSKSGERHFGCVCGLFLNFFFFFYSQAKQFRAKHRSLAPPPHTQPPPTPPLPPFPLESGQRRRRQQRDEAKQSQDGESHRAKNNNARSVRLSRGRPEVTPSSYYFSSSSSSNGSGGGSGTSRRSAAIRFSTASDPRRGTCRSCDGGRRSQSEQKDLQIIKN